MLTINRRDLLGQFSSRGASALGIDATDDGRARIDIVAAEGMTEWDRINLERNLRWIVSRERAARHNLARVGVFADAGVWHVGAWSIVEALEQKGNPCRVLDRLLRRAMLPGGERRRNPRPIPRREPRSDQPQGRQGRGRPHRGAHGTSHTRTRGR
jgi:hypothetical protein